MAPSDKEVSCNQCKGHWSGSIRQENLGDALSNAKISKKPSPFSSSAYSDDTSGKEVSSDEEEQFRLTQPNAVDLMVNKEDKHCLLTQPNAVDGTTEVANKRGSSQSIKTRKGPSNGSSWSEKKQRPEMSNANLANQLYKVPALNANDFLLQATQMTDLNHEDKEEDDDKTLTVTKYFTMPVSGKKQSLW